MNRVSERVFGGFHHRLRERRMGVDRRGDVLERRAEFDREAEFGDQFRGFGADDRGAEDVAVFVGGDDFTKPSESPVVSARPLARNGNWPIAVSKPASSASDSVIPTVAIRGR